MRPSKVNYPLPRREGTMGRGIADFNSMKLICLIILSLLLSANEALAYVDPNTGGYIFQLL